MAIGLPDDEARSVSELVRLPPDELAAFFPGVETVLIAPPGEDGFAVEGTGELTEPGPYAIVCVIPTGEDPASIWRLPPAPRAAHPRLPADRRTS